MLNHAQSRYLAWQSLSNFIKSNIRKYSPGPTYEFKYVPPKTTVRAKLLPFEDWKGSIYFNICSKGKKIVVVWYYSTWFSLFGFCCWSTVLFDHLRWLPRISVSSEISHLVANSWTPANGSCWNDWPIVLDCAKRQVSDSSNNTKTIWADCSKIKKSSISRSQSYGAEEIASIIWWEVQMILFCIKFFY